MNVRFLKGTDGVEDIFKFPSTKPSNEIDEEAKQIIDDKYSTPDVQLVIENHKINNTSNSLESIYEYLWEPERTVTVIENYNPEEDEILINNRRMLIKHDFGRRFMPNNFGDDTASSLDIFGKSNQFIDIELDDEPFFSGKLPIEPTEEVKIWFEHFLPGFTETGRELFIDQPQISMIPGMTVITWEPDTWGV